MRHSFFRAATRVLGVVLAFVLFAASLEGQRRGGGRSFRGGGRSFGGGGVRVSRSFARTSVSRPAVNRAVRIDRTPNVNRNVRRDINRDVDIDIDGCNGWGGCGGCCYRPVARATAAAVTAAAIGSVAYSLPATNCSEVDVNGTVYWECGSTWYKPRFSGESTTYTVVSPP